MKKITLAMLAFLCGLLVSCASTKASDDKGISIEAGKAVITKINYEEKAVKYGLNVDGYQNVTLVDCVKSTKRNIVTVSLDDFVDCDVTIEFSCDIKAVDSTGAQTDIVWFINEVDAGIPQLAREKIDSNKWYHFSGSKELLLTDKRQLYISAAGIQRENLKLYIRNLKVVLYGDQIGRENVEQKSWLDEPSLAQAYAPYFDYIGFATPLRGVLENVDVLEGLSHQASCYTMENEFKPDFIFSWQKPNSYQDFIAEDGKSYKVPVNTPPMGNINKILMTASVYNLKMRGHVLVWHSQTPDWFFRENYGSNSAAFVDEATMNARLEWYIKTVLEYIKAWEDKYNNGERIVITWDVVNEAASDNASVSQWLRTDSNWFRIYKSDRFIVNAFRYANKYAPKDVLLAYNDYGCSSYNKCGAILKIVDAIQAAPDARIDVVGMQSHIGMGTPLTGYNSFETSVQRFVEKGLDVQITELDIGSDGQKYNSEKLKSKYHDFFVMALNNRKTETKNGIRGITLWGIVDERSWIYNNHGSKQHPLLFEKDYVCKPAFYGVLEAAAEEAEKQ
ncbi:MAG: endo-1,4-beta-xylanase [Treponema sp.]|nr:endo-1,4-beta-xylanase [Treponema sp.]